MGTIVNGVVCTQIVCVCVCFVSSTTPLPCTHQTRYRNPRTPLYTHAHAEPDPDDGALATMVQQLRFDKVKMEREKREMEHYVEEVEREATANQEAATSLKDENDRLSKDLGHAK